MATSFATRIEMVNEINKIGAIHQIKEKHSNTAYTYVLMCENSHDSGCEAKILGIYNQKDRLYHIKRQDIFHNCEIVKNAEAVLIHEISKKRYSKMRIGEILEILTEKKYKVSYFDIFKVLFSKQTPGRSLTDKSFRNTFNDKENSTNSIHQSMKMDNIRVDESILKYECLKAFEVEFNLLNPKIVTKIKANQFYFTRPEFSEVLRNIMELKVYERPCGFLILGLLYDPTDEPIVQSMLLTECSKKESLESFIQFNSIANNFYLIELDSEIIDVMRQNNVNFFVKTRSVCKYLEEPNDDDPWDTSISTTAIMEIGNIWTWKNNIT